MAVCSQNAGIPLKKEKEKEIALTRHVQASTATYRSGEVLVNEAGSTSVVASLLEGPQSNVAFRVTLRGKN